MFVDVLRFDKNEKFENAVDRKHFINNYFVIYQSYLLLKVIETQFIPFFKTKAHSIFSLEFHRKRLLNFLYNFFY